MRLPLQRTLKRLGRRIDLDKDVPVDGRIAQNIRAFQKSLPKKAVKDYSRPADWDEKIEIVVPCYNHAKYLNSAFNSIASQSRPQPITVTFVNDASTDKSLNKMEDIRDKNKFDWIKIKIIHNKKNLLQGESINKAIRQSSNQLFVILNADDILTPDCLELVVGTYKKHPDIALLGGMSLWFEDETKLPKHLLRPLGRLRLKKYGPQDARNFSELNSINMSQSSCSFFKNAWELVGGYFEQANRVCSYDDRDFQMRVCAVLTIGIYENYPMEFYRTSSSLGRATI